MNTSDINIQNHKTKPKDVVTTESFTYNLRIIILVFLNHLTSHQYTAFNTLLIRCTQSQNSKLNELSFRYYDSILDLIPLEESDYQKFTSMKMTGAVNTCYFECFIYSILADKPFCDYLINNEFIDSQPFSTTLAEFVRKVNEQPTIKHELFDIYKQLLSIINNNFSMISKFTVNKQVCYKEFANTAYEILITENEKNELDSLHGNCLCRVFPNMSHSNQYEHAMKGSDKKISSYIHTLMLDSNKHIYSMKEILDKITEYSSDKSEINSLDHNLEAAKQKIDILEITSIENECEKDIDGIVENSTDINLLDTNECDFDEFIDSDSNLLSDTDSDIYSNYNLEDDLDSFFEISYDNTTKEDNERKNDYTFSSDTIRIYTNRFELGFEMCKNFAETDFHKKMKTCFSKVFTVGADIFRFKFAVIYQPVTSLSENGHYFSLFYDYAEKAFYTISFLKKTRITNDIALVYLFEESVMVAYEKIKTNI